MPLNKYIAKLSFGTENAHKDFCGIVFDNFDQFLINYDAENHNVLTQVKR